MDQNLVICQGLSKHFGLHRALDQVDITISRGRIIGLLGPNGSGKTTWIKLLCGLLQPTKGSIQIDGHIPDVYTKSVISYLPDRMYFADWMNAGDLLSFFADFYEDFDLQKAQSMCRSLGISGKDRIRAMSKGTKEKLQLAVVMSRRALLYLLDEPVAGVDPAARDYILRTILTNYNPEGTVIISTHLIADVEKVLDEVILLRQGRVVCHDSVDNIRQKEGKSVDALFREIFRTVAFGDTEGGTVQWEN